MTRPELLFAIVCMIVLEINHLKWIWWQYWNCSRCEVTNKDCTCGRSRKVMTYL